MTPTIVSNASLSVRIRSSVLGPPEHRHGPKRARFARFSAAGSGFCSGWPGPASARVSRSRVDLGPVALADDHRSVGVFWPRFEHAKCQAVARCLLEQVQVIAGSYLLAGRDGLLSQIQGLTGHIFQQRPQGSVVEQLVCGRLVPGRRVGVQPFKFQIRLPGPAGVDIEPEEAPWKPRAPVRLPRARSE